MQNIIKNSKRIAFYIRVSTDNQEKAETIENQLRDLYKVYEKTDVVKIYKDNPASGADPDRLGLKELLQDARKGFFDTIAVWDSSRLARDVKLFLIIKDELKECGVKIEIMGKEREDSDSGKLLEIIEAAVDEMERNRIKRRFVSGRDRRLAEGKLIGCYPPYGYRHIRRDREKGTDARLEVNEQEAVIVRKIFNWYLELESIFAVVIRLKKEGIKARGKGREEPGFFLASTVSRILRREDYIGSHYCGKSTPCIAKFHIHEIRKHRYTGRKRNPRSEWKAVKVPVVLDNEIFEKAQKILNKRAEYRLLKSKHEFLCQGIIRCARCGKLYAGRMQAGFPLYRCPQAHDCNLNQPTCRARSVGRNKIESIIWNYVSGLINDKEIIIKNIRSRQEKKKAEEKSNKKVCDNLLSDKKALKIKKSKLLDLYSDPGGATKKEDLDSKMEELNAKEKALDDQILEIEKEMQEIDNLAGAEEEIEKICQLYKKKIQNPTFELKRYIVRKWIAEINIEDDGSIRIKVRIPKGEEDRIVSPDYFKAFNDINLNALNFEFKFEEVIRP